MLRILLIIVVALAIIIGLMRLTGTKPADIEATTETPAPAAEAVELAPVEPAAEDALDVIPEATVESQQSAAEEGAPAEAQSEPDTAPETAAEPQPNE